MCSFVGQGGTDIYVCVCVEENGEGRNKNGDKERKRRGGEKGKLRGQRYVRGGGMYRVLGIIENIIRVLLGSREGLKNLKELRDRQQ